MSSPTAVTAGPDPRARLAYGTAALLAALPLAAAALAIQHADPARPERAVLLVGIFFVAVLGAVVLAYLARQRDSLTPAQLGFVILATSVVLTAAGYFMWAASQVAYHADILIWSESPFVNDIIKLRTGIPLYSAPVDLNSFFYTPGSQVLTYGLARLLGSASSIPTYRLLQLGYVGVAALLGARAVQRLRQLAGGRETGRRWELVWVPLLFLCGTNELTNPFNHLLHNDALALLVSTLAYLLLLEYAVGRSRRVLLLMAVVPLLGFAVKQSLALWLGLYLGYLLLFDRPRALGRIAGFGVGAVGLLAAGYLAGRALWGTSFHYWVITVMGHHPPDLLRVVQHILDSWVYWAAGLGGGLLLLRPSNATSLVGIWVVWVLLFAAEAYTSGIAWMLNHLGPGSMIASIWLCASLPEIWPAETRDARRLPVAWLRAAVLTLIAVLGLAGLRVVRVPLPGLPADADRYASAIEAEFAGLPRDRVLLDQGSWPYLAAGISMRDRSAVVGELGATETGDFSGILGRIRGRYYQRILLRDLDTPDFAYDHSSWRVGSGIRDSLHTYYRVVRTIPPVRGGGNVPIGFREISVLEPRP
jgi:hypothetical protein